MKINLGDNFEFELFQLEEIESVEQLAKETNGSIYSWKTVGDANWLEKGISVADVLGITVLSSELPDWINLPDDEEE